MKAKLIMMKIRTMIMMFKMIITKSQKYIKMIKNSLKVYFNKHFIDINLYKIFYFHYFNKLINYII